MSLKRSSNTSHHITTSSIDKINFRSKKSVLQYLDKKRMKSIQRQAKLIEEEKKRKEKEERMNNRVNAKEKKNKRKRKHHQNNMNIQSVSSNIKEEEEEHANKKIKLDHNNNDDNEYPRVMISHNKSTIIMISPLLVSIKLNRMYIRPNRYK